jgi:hypothetical protein
MAASALAAIKYLRRNPCKSKFLNLTANLSHVAENVPITLSREKI